MTATERFIRYDGPKFLKREGESFVAEIGINVIQGLEPWQDPGQYVMGEDYQIRGISLIGYGATEEEACGQAFARLDAIPEKFKNWRELETEKRG